MTNMSNYHISDNNDWLKSTRKQSHNPLSVSDLLRRQQDLLKIVEGERDKILIERKDAMSESEFIEFEAFTHEWVERINNLIDTIKLDSEYDTMTTCTDCGRDILVKDGYWIDANNYVCRGGCKVGE